MEEKIIKIKREIWDKLESIKDLDTLEEIRIKFLGKKGSVTELLKEFKDLPKEEKPKFGKTLNELKNKIEVKIKEKEEVLQAEKFAKKLEEEKIDVTLPAKKIIRGSKHPLTRVIEEIEDLFVSMGYDVCSGPELETDEYCFERLNLPKGHPARDMQDTFYITTEYLLRTQTSAV